MDEYARRARLEPTMIVILPLALATVMLIPGIFPWMRVLWGLIVWGGGSALIAQIGRDWGKNKEPQLFAKWGGIPTTRMLRHHDTHNKATVMRYHEKLHERLPDLRIPSPEDERASPTQADKVYESCVSFLRETTRDKNKFPLVFEENCNYGFRRNLWGMKPLGIALSAVGTGIISASVMVNCHTKGLVPSSIEIIFGCVNLTLLLIWVIRVTPKWVRVCAEAYAERLLAACDNL